LETGYVVLNVSPRMKKEFIEKAKTIDKVKEAHLVIGIYDAILRIEADTIAEMERIYLNEIDKLPGINNSRLHFVACPRTRK